MEKILVLMYGSIIHLKGYNTEAETGTEVAHNSLQHTPYAKENVSRDHMTPSFLTKNRISIFLKYKAYTF